MTTPRPKSPTNNRLDALPPAATVDPLTGPRADLARVIPRRPRVTWWLGIVLAAGCALLVMPTITAERWLGAMGVGKIVHNQPAPFTVRVPPFAGYNTDSGHTGGGGVLIAKGETASRDNVFEAGELQSAQPHGAVPYLAFLFLVGVLAGLFTHHTRRSTMGRLLRVQLVSLGLIVATAIVVKLVMLTTALSVLVVPVAVFSMVPTLVLDRVVGLATGTLAALVISFVVPFDVGVAVMLMVQAGAAGLMVDERPKRRLRAILVAGATATLFTAATYPLMLYLSAGRLPLGELHDPLHSAWLASALGPALATALTIVFVPLYQLAVGEITQQKLVELEDLSHPLLKQISERAPGTWQHSLTMANMAEIAANAIGANGRLVRVGAYFHDLGKSLNPKYFIENLEPGETSPHDKLPPEVSCDQIFKHVTEGIITARKSGLHERIIDFMHMHHGNGVLEYFWAKCREQGNPKKLTVEHFRYPGVPPQSRETAILSICDAVEAAARTLKKPDVASIDSLVQRIVYGKLHLGQLDQSGLSMGDLRRISESLRDTIRHANHGRIEYPWQKAQQDASAHPDQEKLTQTGPRLDSLDRPARPDVVQAPAPRTSADALAETDSAGATPKLRPQPRDSSELAMLTTAPVLRPEPATLGGSPSDERPASLAGPLPSDLDVTRPAPRTDFELTVPAPKLEPEEVVELIARPKTDTAKAAKAEAARAEAAKAEAAKAEAAKAHAKADAAKADAAKAEAAKPQPKSDQPDAELDRASLRELAARQSATTEPSPDESDARMRRTTNPVGERKPSEEVAAFAAEAKQALDDATKEMVAIPRAQATTQPVEPSAIVSERSAFDSSPVIEIIHDEGAPAQPAVETPSAARKRAATLPPIKPPTIPPPLGRKPPTIPPAFGNRPPTNPPAMTAPPPDMLRPPAQAQVPLPGMTAPPPSVVRPPGMNYLDDMITLRPQYEPKPDLIVKQGEDGSVLIEPAKPPPKPADDAATTRPAMLRDDAATTRPAMLRDDATNERTGDRTSDGASDGGDDDDGSPEDALITQPRMAAAVGDTTDPDVALPETDGAPLSPESSWARGLAARLDAQLEEDFGTETPVVAPTKAELQALLNSAPDPTRKQSLDEIERLHEQSRAAQSQELDFTRRASLPTSEIDEADIEAAIELAPPARRNAIGVAKKKRED